MFTREQKCVENKLYPTKIKIPCVFCGGEKQEGSRKIEECCTTSMIFGAVCSTNNETPTCYICTVTSKSAEQKTWSGTARRCVSNKGTILHGLP